MRMNEESTLCCCGSRNTLVAIASGGGGGLDWMAAEGERRDRLTERESGRHGKWERCDPVFD
jgi:hypothetical protein